MRSRPRAFVLGAALALGFVIACGRDASPPLDRYQVRGVVEDLHGTGADTRAIIHHEAIPSFKDRAGHASGMKAMKMAFGVSPAVDRALLKKGAKVGLTIDVDWQRRPVVRITGATALPQHTKLDTALER